MPIDWMNPQGQAVDLSGISPGDTSWYKTEAPRFMAGFASGDPEFQNYWNQYGSDPSMGTESFWENPAQGYNWMTQARAGGTAEQQRQHQESQKKGFLGLGKGVDLAALAALAYFGVPAITGAGAGAGAALSGEAAFGGGMAAELAWGAPELAGMAAGGSSLAGGGLAAELAWGAPELAGMAAGNFANAALPATGFFSNLLSNPWGSITNAAKGLMPGTSGGVPTAGPSSGNGSMPWGTMASVGSIATGLFGLDERKKLQRTASQAAQMQDPFGSQRPQYQAQLAALMANPQSITNVPGFDAGRLAVERSMAAQGYNPASSKISGNYLDAMGQYGGNFYNQEVQRLMQLAGAGIPPSGGNILMSGQMGSTALTGQALQSILAGIRGLSG